ncbi:MAG: hypothetical protein AB7K71_06175 [Polyangiaceae bacterium]
MFSVTLLLCKSGDLLLVTQSWGDDFATTLDEFERLRWDDVRSGEDLKPALVRAIQRGEENAGQPNGSDADFLPYMTAVGARSMEAFYSQLVAVAGLAPWTEDEWSCSSGQASKDNYELFSRVKIPTAASMSEIAEVVLSCLRAEAEPPKKARKR